MSKQGLSLYNITNKFVELMDKAQEGELAEEEYNQLGEEIALELQNKGTSIVGYALNEMVLIDAMDAQIKRLQDMKKARQNKLDNFKKYVKENMERLNLSKLETELGTISIQKSPKATVEILDEEKVPNKYKKIVQEIKIDKTAIAQDAKETGEAIEGTRVLIGTYLRIK